MKKLQASKIVSDIKGVAVKGSGASWEIETENDSQKSKVVRLLRAAGVQVGGYRCGHGGWNLRENYAVDTSDFGDRSSPVHY